MFLSAAAVIFTFTAVGRAVPETYMKGGVAVLSPGSVSGPIATIMWKHGTDIAVEWYGQETTAYQDFKGRCELNTTTAVLTISKLTLKDSGRYTAEINSRVMKTTEIRVIAAVPKPTISTHCNPEGTQCTLTCDANITKNTGAVSYSWEIGDRHIPESPGNWIDITKDDTESVGKLISCQLENPVSRERSDDIMNPFTPNRSSEGVNKPVVLPIVVIVVIVLIVLIVVIAAALAGFVFWDKHRQQNAHKSWRQYFARFDPRSCRNPERNRMTQNTNGAVTGLDYQAVPTQDQDRPVPTGSNSEAATSPENQTVTNQDQQEPVSTRSTLKIANEAGSDHTPAELTEPSSETKTSAVALNAEELPDQHPQQEDETREH